MPESAVVAALLGLAMQRVTPDPPPGLLRQARELGLDAELQDDFAMLAPTDGRLRRDQLAHVTQRVQDVTAARLVNPFREAPAALLPDGLAVATQVGNDAPIKIRRNGIMLAVGPPGAGKTTLLNHALLAARADGAHAIVYELKRDTTEIALHDEDFVIIDGDSPVNFVERPPWEQEKEFVANFVEWWGRGQYSGQQQSHVIHEALTNVLDQHEHPCLADLKTAVDKMDKTTATYARRDAVQGVSRRLQRIKDQYRVPFTTREGVPLAKQLDRSIYVVADAHNEITEWVFTYYYVHHAFTRNRAQQRRSGLTHVVVMDESLFSLSKEHAATKFGGMNLMAYLATLLREYAISLWVSGIHYESIDPLISKAAATTILLHGLTDTQSLSWHLALTREECAYLNHELQLGHAVFKCHGPWRHAILATYPPLDRDKTVDTNSKAWQAARARLAALLPHKAPESESSDGQVPPPHPTPVPPPGPEPELPGVIALNATEEALLRFVADNGGISTVTEAYDGAGLHYSIGDTAKQKLLRLGLITATPIVACSGRGGSAIALQLTTAGYDRIVTTPPRRSRGGGAQSEYLIQNLHKYLPGSSIEVTLG